MKTQLLAAIVSIIALPLWANPQPSPIYGMSFETVNVKMGYGKTTVTATYRFQRNGTQGSGHLNSYDDSIQGIMKGSYQPKVYFPIYLPEAWKHDAHAMRTIRFKATMYQQYRRRRLRMRTLSVERSDGKHLGKDKIPTVEGVRMMWLMMKLQPGESPASFELDVTYEQPNMMDGKTPVFTYMPLLPDDHKPSLNFTMTVTSADKKPVTVQSGSSGGIFRKDESFLIQLSAEKVVKVAYGKEDPQLKMIPKLVVAKK